MKMNVKAGRFVKIYNPSENETEPWYMNDHCFIQDRTGLWHMFGITQTEPAKALEEKFLAHATSTNLLNPQWEKQEHVLRTDYHRWNETVVWAPHIIEYEDKYYMFYCAGGDSHSKYKIHLAISDDLWNWERHEANPMIIDGFDARDPMILRHENEWIMYYTANSSPVGGNHTVAAVTSKDLVHWSDKSEVFISSESGTYGGPTESPFVVKRNDRYYLFVCTNAPYNTSAVYESDNPFEWNESNRVGSFPSHASEVIHLPSKDKYYLSRAGWGEGGLYLAELLWDDIDFEQRI